MPKHLNAGICISNLLRTDVCDEKAHTYIKLDQEPAYLHTYDAHRLYISRVSDVKKRFSSCCVDKSAHRYVRTCIYTYIHTHIYKYTHTHIHRYTCTHHACMYIYTYIHMQVDRETYMHIHGRSVLTPAKFRVHLEADR